MSEMLDRDKVAALVEAAKQGQLPEQGPSSTHRRGQRLRTVDFSRPTKFTSDHQRRISRAIDTFCQTSVTRLSTELRTPIELEAINSAQATWSGAQSQLPTGSLFVTLDVQPLGTRMLFTVEQSFVLMCLDLLLGGSVDKPPRERRFSEIDTVLTQRLFESLVHQLTLVLTPFGEQRRQHKRAERHGHDCGLRRQDAFPNGKTRVAENAEAESRRPDDRKGYDEGRSGGKQWPAPGRKP